MSNSIGNKQAYTGEPEKTNLPSQRIQSDDAFSSNKYTRSEEDKIDTLTNGNYDLKNGPNTFVEPKQYNSTQGHPTDINGDAATSSSTKDDLRSVAVKLKTQNEKLKGQLKELSSKLAETLAKVKARNKKKENQKSENKPEDPMMKELELANRQISLYKREIQSLRNKMEASQSDVRTQAFENKIKDKERIIENILHENSNLEKLRRDQEKELEMFHDVFNYQGKIKNFDDEGKKLRAKIREMYEEMRRYEKDFKAQQSKLVILEERYRDGCDRIGISASLNFTKAEDSNKFRTLSPKGKYKKKPEKVDLTKGNKYFGYNVDKEDQEDAKLELNQNNLNKLQQDCKNAKKEMEALENKYKLEIQQLMSQLNESEKEKITTEDKLRDKEKEVNILNHRLSEFKRITKFNALQISPKSSLENGKITLSN